MRAQCGNVPMLATLILREINFGFIWMVKNCHFNNFGGFEFSFLGILDISNVEFFQKSKFKAS